LAGGTLCSSFTSGTGGGAFCACFVFSAGDCGFELGGGALVDTGLGGDVHVTSTSGAVPAVGGIGCHVGAL